MIQLIYLEKYDWLIKVFYITNDTNIDLILKELDDIDCHPEIFYEIAEILESEILNTGITYTDNSKHVTFMIIGKSECPKEFMSTYIHEVGHAACHIAQYYNINLIGEDYQYLNGEIALEMFDVAKNFLCDCHNKEKETL